MAKLGFQIFIAGKSQRNDLLVQHYSEACRSSLAAGSYDIKVIDLLTNTQLAEHHKILATPTICRINPAPEKRIIGNVSSETAVKALKFLIEDLKGSEHEKN